MAVCALSKAFRRLNIFKKDDFPVRFITTKTESSFKVVPSLLSSLQLDKPQQQITDNLVKFSPRSVGLTFDIPRNELPIRQIIESPIIPNFQIDEPAKNIIEKGDITPSTSIEAPTMNNIIEKRAAVMIVIRRKKMKKHKRRKFLKRMKFVIRKRELRKQLKKDKEFQIQLQEIQKKAEDFDPKEYVAERLHVLTRERLPNRWMGWRAPESMIKQFIKQREEANAHRERMRTYRLKVD